MESGVTNITNKQAEIAAQKITGEKFCTQCQRYRAIEGGRIKMCGSHARPTKRWQCAECADKRRNVGEQ